MYQLIFCLKTSKLAHYCTSYFSNSFVLMFVIRFKCQPLPPRLYRGGWKIPRRHEPLPLTSCAYGSPLDETLSLYNNALTSLETFVAANKCVGYRVSESAFFLFCFARTMEGVVADWVLQSLNQLALDYLMPSKG